MSKFAGYGLAVDQPARMTIRHPDSGEPLVCENGEPGWIDVLSADSEAGQKQQRAAQNARLVSRKRQLTAEDIEAEGVAMLAALTVGWRLLVPKSRGNNVGLVVDVPFSPANATELYTERGMAWLKDQVNTFAADRGNFLRT